jgi:hypothetical protein
MKLVDIDKLVALDSHIDYIKKYQGSVIFMNKQMQIYRYNIKFVIEYKPIGDPDIKINFLEHPHFPIVNLISKIKKKIQELDYNGILSTIHNDN